MKLVHLLQLLLLGVAVFGRAIEEKIADTRVVTGDAEQLPYRFRYNVASQDSGDYKSQTESRDAAGVVTGMYQVLQPDGCVRVVHYTADAMGFHPTVTYEGDCQPAGSINTAATSDSALPSLKDVSAPINPSAAFLSRPVLSAVPGLINPLTTDVRDSAQETFIPRPSQQIVSSQDSSAASSTPQQVVIGPSLTATTSLSQKNPVDIDRLWQSLGEPSRPAAGIVPSITSNGNSAVKAQAPSEEIIVESKLPEGLSTKLPVSPSNTQTVSDVAVESTKQVSVINEVPEIVPAVITGKVQSTDAVPDSILSLLETFEPTKTTSRDEEVDPLEAQPSEFSERILKDESESSVASLAVESAPEESVQTVVEETVQSKTSETAEPVVEVQSDEAVVSAPEASKAIHIDEAVKSADEETIESKSIPQSDETKVDLDETAHEEEYSFKSVDEETIQPKNDDTVEVAAPESDETNSEKERSLGTLTQSALGNVKNFTAPLTQLISSSVQNLTNPVAALLNTFNRNKLTTTVAPSTVSVVTEVTPVTVEPTVKSIPPAGKIETEGETDDTPSGKLIVTDNHNQEEEAFPGTDGAVSDIPAVSQHTKQTTLVAEDTPAEEEEAERIISLEEGDFKNPVVQNLESISIEVNDPATAVVVEPVPSAADDIPQDSTEPTVKVPDNIPVDAPVIAETIVSVADPVPAGVAEGTLVESSKVASLEETPSEQVRADVRETSSFDAPVETENVKESKDVDLKKENAELYQVNDEDTLPETYASIIGEPVPVIYSHQVATGPFFVQQPAAIVSPHAYPMSVRHATARALDSVAATPYGLRVQKFVPTYGALGNAPPTYVYNQHRRQGHYQTPLQQQMQYYQQPYAVTRFAPAAAPIRGIKKHGEANGMRYTAVQAPPKKLHYAVRPKAPKQPTWSPLYSTYVY